MEKIEIETTLTKGQIAKFTKLEKSLIISNNIAYLPVTELHGVLLTNSRERAREILNIHAETLKNYFLKKENISVILPIGIYLLLDKLAISVPKKATDYRASIVFLSSIIAKNDQLKVQAWEKAKEQLKQETAMMIKLKKKHQLCQLTRQAFTEKDQKHAHHILGKSEQPECAVDENNLIIIKGDIHNDYHNWLSKQGLPINKGSLYQYCVVKKLPLVFFDRQQNIQLDFGCQFA